MDALLCITDKPIVLDDEGKLDWDYDCWWTDPGEGNIILFSASLPGMPNTLPGLGQVLSQLLVASLAGLFANEVGHERRPKDCPLYANSERSLKIASAPQKFDHKCTKRLKRKMGDDFAALETILEVFH